LFIVVHQVYELWFKELIFELTSARDAIFDNVSRHGLHLLHRAHAIERVLIEQVSVLESMSPQDFLEFRTHLAPASGFQSVGFRAVEFVSGLKDASYLTRLRRSDGATDVLARLLDEPTLWDAFCALVERRGLPMPAEDDDQRRASLVRLAHDRAHHADAWDVCEALLTHDELFRLWRTRHVLMVERQIGSKSGTGGSTGASYLRTTLDKTFYPDLWSLRSYL
jgi:tryptophan 2,3-dioxygenase